MAFCCCSVVPGDADVTPTSGPATPATLSTSQLAGMYDKSGDFHHLPPRSDVWFVFFFAKS